MMDSDTLCMSMRASNVPEHLIPALSRYLRLRDNPGGFLKAVLSNDLILSLQYKEASTSMQGLQDLVLWVYQEAPSFAWGSSRAVDAWLRSKEGVESSVKS
jgi:hypothetical protein